MIEKAILSYPLEKQRMLLKEQHVLIMISVAFPQTAHQLHRRVLKRKNRSCMLGKNLSYHNDALRPKRNVMHIFVRDNNSWHGTFQFLETWLENTELYFRIRLKRLTPKKNNNKKTADDYPNRLSQRCKLQRKFS